MITNNMSDFAINRSLQSLSTGTVRSNTLSIHFPPQEWGGGGREREREREKASVMAILTVCVCVCF